MWIAATNNSRGGRRRPFQGVNNLCFQLLTGFSGPFKYAEIRVKRANHGWGITGGDSPPGVIKMRSKGLNSIVVDSSVIALRALRRNAYMQCLGHAPPTFGWKLLNSGLLDTVIKLGEFHLAKNDAAIAES